MTPNITLSNALWGSNSTLRNVVLVAAGIAILAISAKIAVPMWPVPITMGTFAVLALGATYGPRLGLVTILGYMLLGAMGFNVFAGTGGDVSGLAYMMGGTGGYLLGFVLATVLLGYGATRGWDRSVLKMAGLLLVANVLIYVPGLAWLMQLYGWELVKAVELGMVPYLIGDAVKLGLVALLLPGLWKLLKGK
ncbi:MAG: biotin transporter BioY [Rhodobacteraceae bacterium]|nr:biotin transporter BioY [Paracoccaceae bacterium]